MALSASVVDVGTGTTLDRVRVAGDAMPDLMGMAYSCAQLKLEPRFW